MVFSAAVFMVMVVAADIRIVYKRFRKQRSDRLVRASGYASVPFNSGFMKRVLSARADSAADQGIDLPFAKHSGQGAVTAAVGRNDLRIRHLSVLNRINFELFRMAEMLKYVSVLISYCNFHL